MLDDLVFLRPWALWLLPIAALIYLLARLWRASANQNLTNWIDPALLPYLSLSAQKRRSQRLLAPALALVWLLLCLALAAPSWSSREVPLRQNQQPLLVLLDLSWSMNATDLQPDRVSWARFKLEDLLKSRKDGLTGLVVYSGSAHLVVPFSSDQETILNLLPDLQPGIMPINGSRLDLALELAAQTYSDSGFADHGHLLIFTDGIALDTAERSADLLADIPASVSIIAIGNDNGVPIRSGDGFVRDNNGDLVLSQSDWRGLDYLRANSNATLQRMQLDSSDIDSLLSKLQASSEDLQRQLAIREDQSHWLLLALLPLWLGLWIYGRGSVLLALLALGSPQAQAEAFRNQDQQALELLRSEQYQQAAELFTSPEWRGYAHARQGDYRQALEELSDASDPSSVYNRGNAQLKSMQIEDAIATYEQLLESEALAEQLRADTEYNLAIAEQMLELMQQQQGEQQQGEQQQGQQQQGDQQQGQQDQQQGDQQQGDQQQSQQQQSQQQDAQQQDGQQQDGQQQQGQQQDGQQQQGQQQAEQQSDESGNEQQQAAQQAEASGAEQQQSLSQQQQQLAQQLAEQAEASDEQQEGEDNGEQLSAEQMARIQARQQLQRQLQAIPDDPGGLLRRKFELQARQMSRPRYESIEDQL